ncbi:hypothetical protein HI914_03546 [Erysiphe necator]|nr:hypothetical protein HI914_03546 [Erysiphe necator]
MLVNLSNRFALNNNCHKKEEDSYYDNYLMTVGLMKSCKFGTTDFKIIPKSFSAKVHDVYDYCTKKLVITYPDGKISEFLRIPNVVLYKERSLDFNKTGVFLGVPRVFTKTLQSCLQSIIINPLFEDKVIKSDKNYWWTQAILSDTFVGNNCIFIISMDEDGNYIEETFSSFEELFEKTSSSVLINIQCNILLTSKVPVEKIGMEWPEDLSRMSIIANSINVTDLSDVPKPKLWQPIKARVSPKDVASDALLERLALR